MSTSHQLILHSLIAKHGTLALDVELHDALGYDGIEIGGNKIQTCLDDGLDPSEIKALIGQRNVPGVGYLPDIERQGNERDALMEEAERLFGFASLVGARAVQVITGPISIEAVASVRDGRPSPAYAGLLDRSLDEQLTLTARNLAMLADLAAKYDLLLYLEGLSWTPVNTIARQLDVIKRAGRDNVKMVIDFWHCFTSGNTPADVARIPARLIYGVHICDSLAFPGGIPDERILRDVPTGEGVLPLQDWVDAVKHTGYQGWWSCELFCRRNHQQTSRNVAGSLKRLMERLVLAS